MATQAKSKFRSSSSGFSFGKRAKTATIAPEVRDLVARKLKLARAERTKAEKRLKGFNDRGQPTPKDVALSLAEARGSVEAMEALAAELKKLG